MSSYVAIITTRTNRQIIKYRGKWLHWEQKSGCVYNDTTKRGNARTSHEGQHVRQVRRY